MNKKTLVRNICYGGAIAAIYAGLTLLLQAISFGPVQVRISEALTLLPILTPAAVPGLALGCLISGLMVSAWQDLVFGTLATLLAALLTRRLRKNVYLAALMPVVCNGLVVGVTLYWLYGGSWLLNIATVALGEAVACFALGIPLLRLLQKTPNLFR